MSGEFSRARRFAVAFLALLCAAAIFKGQIASALVIRGDDYLYRGDRAHALERYRRAMSLAPAFSVAADRFVFVMMQQHTRDSLNQAIAVATGYLHAHPHDSDLLTDRALCYLHLRRYAFAQRDFERAAHEAHAPSDYVFAGWAAQRAGHARIARALWRRALLVRPGYRPAIIALSEHDG